ncbi:MAG: class I SAM-dependent methyltransferase [Ktedonobacterales bacterium]
MAVEEIYRHPEDYELEMAAHGEDDLSFWRGVLACEHPRRVLEVGCGTGRLTIPLARAGNSAGFTVTGIDSEPTMLRRAEERAASEPPAVRAALRLLQADVCELQLTEQFDVIMMPYGVAHHLTSLDEQLSAWRVLHEHLVAGGLLAVEVTAPSLGQLAQATTGTPRTTDLDVRDSNGTHLLRSVVTTYCPTTQLALHAFSYTICTVDGKCRAYESHFTMHVYFPSEFVSLFAATGFTVERLIGSYDGKPLATNSTLMIALARPDKRTEAFGNGAHW